MYLPSVSVCLPTAANERFTVLRSAHTDSITAPPTPTDKADLGTGRNTGSRTEDGQGPINAQLLIHWLRNDSYATGGGKAKYQDGSLCASSVALECTEIC